MGLSDIAKGVPGWNVLFSEPPKPARPYAFDPKRANWKGYTHRPVIRIVHRKTQQVKIRHEMSVIVQSAASQHGVRAAVKPTAGGFHVDYPTGDASTTRVFTLSARTGDWPRGYVDGEPDGMAALAMLNRVFNAYIRGDFDRDEYRLEFFNPDEPVDGNGEGDALWEVVPQQQSDQRTAGVADWRLSLRLEAVARLDAKDAGFKRTRIEDTKKKRGFFDMLREAERFLADNSFEAWFFRYQLLLGPLTRIQAAQRKLLGFVQGWNRGLHEFIGYPMGLIGAMVDDFDALIAEFERGPGGVGSDGWGDWGQIRSDWRQVTGRRRAVVRLRNAAKANAASSSPPLGGAGDRQGGRIAAGSQIPSPMQAAGAALTADNALRGEQVNRRRGEMSTQIVTVGPRMTLDSLVPPGFTRMDLLQLNPDLEWPFVDGTRGRPAGYAPAEGAPRVAYQGDSVRVPVPATGAPVAANASALNVPQASEDERLFGRDLLVDEETRGLVFDEHAGDLATVAGMPNLLQRLRHALIQPLGSLRYAPDVGSYLLAEGNAWADDNATRLDAIAVRRTVQNDPGILEVGRVDVTMRDGVKEVRFDAIAIGATPTGVVALAV